MSDDPWGPPGDPWAPPQPAGAQPAWDAPAWSAPAAPWGPPGWEQGQGPNVVLPMDPFERLMATRRRALWYGVGALVLAVLAPPAAFIGLVTLILGVGVLILLGAIVAEVTAVVWAVVSLTMLARNRGYGASQVLPALPAVAALGAVAWFLVYLGALR